jgi:hypothetical protein
MEIENCAEKNAIKEIKEKRKAELLEEIFIWFTNYGKFPEKGEFRVAYLPADLDILDEMERGHILQIYNHCYEIPLSYLRKLNLWDKEKEITERVRKKLKDFYEDDYKKERTIEDILDAFKYELGMDVKKIQRALYYLSRANFINQSHIDPQTQEYKSVCLSEAVRLYTFDQKIERDEKLRQQNLNLKEVDSKNGAENG